MQVSPSQISFKSETTRKNFLKTKAERDKQAQKLLSSIKPDYEQMIARQDILRKIRAPVIDIPRFDSFGKVQDKTSKVMLKKKLDVIESEKQKIDFSLSSLYKNEDR